ncbi:ubiquitin thioesterase OTUB1-like isoform X2 [Gordionus sp. m RMFG-2023]|uniref:ubiquitin thioesterase OTUB1-like isoform X2 n=1 Tax=Gordionus sp. m RMFG-2023 TaxID=3053472 RepID=UPI0031FDCA58
MLPVENIYEHDENILTYQKRLEEEIASTYKLIGEKQKFEDIFKDYDNDPLYIEKLKELSNKYAFIRRVRGDGNCFFRAFAFSYFEYLSNHKLQIDKFLSVCKDYKSQLINSGTSDYILEDFYQSVETSLISIRDNLPEGNLDEIFNDDGLSNYIVIYLRLITSRYLINNADFFQNFIEGYDNVENFCAQEVEVMNRESDHIHILALSSALSATILIEYLDRNLNPNNADNDVDNSSSNQISIKSSNQHTFGSDGNDDSPSQIYLLYKPGHYDIIYPKLT